MSTAAVRVAVRVRPLTQKEILCNSTETVSFIPGVPQLIIGKDHTFTYDHVFDAQAEQEEIYSKSVLPLVEKYIDGFNATILAYGQTGSGKTYSMGTAIGGNMDSINQQGIVPRFIHDLFDGLDNKKSTITNFESQVLVSFLELYNEDFVDLLSFQQRRRANSAAGSSCEISIREDNRGNIFWSGVREESCDDPRELLGYLAKGSLNRTTGATDMNAVSSRSHAIFSVILKQTLPDEDNPNEERKTVVSKFHFVDLAGSERLDRTGAQGVRAREGIAINSGLLALGNVISALGDESRRSTHIPYRDSKLTRLLQDSLGGNSQTLMVACVSPADSNMQETLSTLKYANRARNIKNRVSVNQEFVGSSIEINQLRSQISKLRMELNLARSNGGVASSSSTREVDSQALRNEINRLRSRIQETSDELCQVAAERDTLLLERQQFSSDAPITTLPMVANYQKTICCLRNELEDTKERLAFIESTQRPMLHALAMASHVTPTTSASRSLTRVTRKKRSRPNVAFRSTRPKTASDREPRQEAALSAPLPVSAIDQQNIDHWLQETIGPLKAAQSTDIRDDVRNSISKARVEIKKGLRVLEDIKPRDQEQRVHDLDCDLASDAGLIVFDSKVSDSLFNSLDNGVLEGIHCIAPPVGWDSLPDTTPKVDNLENDIGGGHWREPSGADTHFTEDTELAEMCQSNPDLARVIDQIQSDIHVKEELVSQLERCESEYVHMRYKFEQKLSKLGLEILSIKRERDHALRRCQIQSQHSPSLPRLSTEPIGQREKLQLTEMRHAYEQKIKMLHSELSEVRRKMNQVASEMQASRNQNQTMKRALKVNIESSKLDKRRMIQRMKEDAIRTKEQMTAHERDIRKLRRCQQRDAEKQQRLERDNKRIHQMLRKKSDEMLVADDKLRKIGQILRKAMRESGMLDESMLAECAELLHVGASLLSNSSRPKVPSSSNTRRSKRKSAVINRIPVHIRAAKKKELLDRALFQYIQGKQVIMEMQQLITKRSELSQKKGELLSEREQLYGIPEFSCPSNNLIPFDHAMQNYMDDRIEAISAEISYINARIQSLHNDAAHVMLEEEDLELVDLDMQQQKQRPVKRVTFADEVMGTVNTSEEDEWLDMDALEERYSLSTNADPDTSHDMAFKVIRSLVPEEAEKVMEVLVEDIAELRMGEFSRHSQVQQLEKTIQDLQNTLSAMKDKDIETATTDDKNMRGMERCSSRRSTMSGYCCDKVLQDDDDSAIDVRVEEHISHFGNLFSQVNQTTAATTESWPPSPVLIERDNSQTSSGTSPSIHPQTPQPSFIDRPPSAAARRDSMSSPEQFLQQLVQEGLMTTAHTKTDAIVASSQIPPHKMPIDAFFDSFPMRRTSAEITPFLAPPIISASAATPTSDRPRSLSLQQQPLVKSQRRFSLRELSLNEHANSDSRTFNDLHHPSPLQQQFVIPDSPPATPSSRSPPSPPQDPPANVFDRLSSSHTRASVAKRSSTPIRF